MVEREWIVKRTGKRRIVDRDICCVYVDEKTGTKCDWKTTDSARQTADQEGEYDKLLTTQQRLEKNILRWVVPSKQPFTVVQDPDFKQIFLSLATDDEFKKQRPQLKDDLSTTCSTISLDATASLSSRG